MHKKFTTKLATTLFVLFSLISIQVASAISLGGINGKPAGNPYSSEARSWFVYTLEPGSEIEDAVEVYNPSDKEKTIYLYPADSTPSSDGGFALKQRSEEMDALGSWIEIEEAEVTLPPKNSATIPFTIKVPSEGLDVGEHSGGIMIEEKQAAVNNGSGILLSTRVGIRTYITIPGDIIRQIDFDFLKADVSRYREYQLPFGLMPEQTLIKIPEAYNFRMGVINNGNVGTDIKYTFQVEDVLFNKYNTTIEKEQKTERNTPTVTHFVWDTPLFGKYRINVVGNYDEGGKTLQSSNVEIWIIPWDIIIGIAFFLLAILLIVLIRRHYSKRKKPLKKGKKKV